MKTIEQVVYLRSSETKGLPSANIQYKQAESLQDAQRHLTPKGLLAMINFGLTYAAESLAQEQLEEEFFDRKKIE